jgi:hypothetical protein
METEAGPSIQQEMRKPNRSKSETQTELSQLILWIESIAVALNNNHLSKFNHSYLNQFDR